MAMSPSFTDRQLAKFRETSSGDTAVAVVKEDDELISGKDYDTISVSYPTTTTEVYEYKLSSIVIKTITVTYTTSSKKILQEVTYAL
tara:strand:- start:306 stop:566 length:261 start_codon:yes stop_codon:yes gene_type:complete